MLTLKFTDTIYIIMSEDETSQGIKIVREPITRQEAQEIGKKWYPELVKGVVDIEKAMLALGGEYHMDANVILVDAGSAQDKVWGFNIYPDKVGDDFIEYVSLINIRPAVGNRGMMVENEGIRNSMRVIIEKLII
jgi:hypothetical protein